MLKAFKLRMVNLWSPLYSLGAEYKLFILGLFLLPYDGVPILPFTYRPMAAIPICIAGILLLIKNRERGSRAFFRHRALVVFSLFAVGISVVQTLLADGEVGRFVRFLITGLLGVVIYLTLFELIRSCYRQFGFSETVNFIFRIIAIAYLPALVFGIVELCSIYGIIDPAINSDIMPYFGAWQPDRIYITSREASWASVHMLIAVCAYFHCLIVFRKPLYIPPLIIALFLFLMTKSMQGVLILVVGMILYIVWYCCTCGSWKRASLVIVGSCVVALLGYFGMYAVMSMQPGYYYAQRFLSINSLHSVVDLIYQDSSSFTRLVSPVIGVTMMMDNLPFGIGGCMYAEYYPELIDACFPWAIQHPEVSAFYSGYAEASPFCLYTRLMAEFGFFGLFFVFALISGVWRKLLNLSKMKGSATLSMFVLIMLAYPLQFDSYYNVPFLLAIALALSFGIDSMHCLGGRLVGGTHFRN